MPIESGDQCSSADVEIMVLAELEAEVGEKHFGRAGNAWKARNIDL